MTAKQAMIAGAFFALMSVALGAFGAHALKATLAASQQGDNFDLAVRYQFFHALALLFSGLWMSKTADMKSLIPLLFVAGIILFCGGLYVVALGGPAVKPVAAIIPVGGLCFIAGWGWLLVRFVKQP